MRVLCEACGAETDPRPEKHLKLMVWSGSSWAASSWGVITGVWCAPCGVRVLAAIESVSNQEMAEVAPLRVVGS